MPILKKKQLFVESHSVDLCTEKRVLFFDENWNLKVKDVYFPASRSTKLPASYIIFKKTLLFSGHVHCPLSSEL